VTGGFCSFPGRLGDVKRWIDSQLMERKREKMDGLRLITCCVYIWIKSLFSRYFRRSGILTIVIFSFVSREDADCILQIQFSVSLPARTQTAYYKYNFQFRCSWGLHTACYWNVRRWMETWEDGLRFSVLLPVMTQTAYYKCRNTINQSESVRLYCVCTWAPQPLWSTAMKYLIETPTLPSTL